MSSVMDSSQPSMLLNGDRAEATSQAADSQKGLSAKRSSAKSVANKSLTTKSSAIKSSATQAAGRTRAKVVDKATAAVAAKVTAKATTRTTAKPKATAKPKSSSKASTALEPGTTSTGSITSVIGEITGLYDGYLQGWAFDADNSDVCLAIEVCFDGVYGQLVRADEFVMHAPEAAQMHGFTVKLKDHWLANAKRISARVANQGPWLAGSVYLDEDGQATVEHQGNDRKQRKSPSPSPSKSKSTPNQPNNESATRVYYAGGLKLVGWAMKAQGSTTSKKIRVVQGEALVASVTANNYVGFLGNRLQQGQGFEIDLPWSMADGKRHELEVLDETGESIKGSPVEICISATSQASVLIDAWRAAAQDVSASEPIPPAGLLNLIAAHERVYPPSFGFVHYPYWYSLYQMPSSYQPTQARVAVLVIAADRKHQY